MRYVKYFYFIAQGSVAMAMAIKMSAGAQQCTQFVYLQTSLNCL